jgi:hypothetical protein
MFHLPPKEESLLKRLDTPLKIQDYLDSLPFNHEQEGETCMSPVRVLREKKAHCIEGAMLACAALMLHGKPPLVLNLKVMKGDVDHVVVLFRQNGYWGAISKTNHAVLRYRDPVYASVRELAMSYFHEYFLVKNGKKTMVGFSRPINLRRFGTRWLTEENDLWNVAATIYDSPHVVAVPEKNARRLHNASQLERKAASLVAG